MKNRTRSTCHPERNLSRRSIERWSEGSVSSKRFFAAQISAIASICSAQNDRLLPLLLIFATLSGCNPYEYSMGRQHIVSCKVLTPLPSVEQGRMVSTLHDRAAIN